MSENQGLYETQQTQQEKLSGSQNTDDALPIWYADLVQFLPLIEEQAEYHGLDKDLICAIILTESSAEPNAVRCEMMHSYGTNGADIFISRWKYYTNVGNWAQRVGITAETEYVLQATSWGLMQVMGSVARELGFSKSLVEMLKPRNSVFYGCKKLKQLRSRYSKESDIIAAYNAGSVIMKQSGMYMNQGYVDKVWQHLHRLRQLNS